MKTHKDMTPHQPASAGRPLNRWAALAVLCVSLLIVTLDNTILNVALPTLVRRLGATTVQLEWIVDAYAVVFAGLMLVAGSTADRFGRRRVFLAGLLVFGAASGWAAFSGSVGMLIAARALMGAGAAMLMPPTLSIITDMFRDPGQRQRAIGMWAATSGLGIAVGPVAGGLLLAHFWWGSIFLVNVPFAVLGIAGALWLVPDSRDPVAARPDPGGAVLSVAGLGLLLWAVIDAPVHGWTSPVVLGAGSGGLAVLAVFAAWERASRHPMLDLGFFRSRRFSVATSSVALAMFSLFGALFVLTQFLQFGLGYSAIATGVRILPVAGVLAAAAPLSTVLVRAAGSKAVVTAGLLVIGGGLWLLSGATASSTYPDLLGGMVLLGLGAGLVVPTALDSLMGSLPPGRTGVGSATNGVAVQVGGALGVAVVGSLLATRYQHRVAPPLAGYHLPRPVADVILGSLGGALEVARRAGGQAGALLSDLARSAFLSGMTLGLLVAAGVTVVGAVLALAALPSRPPAAPAAMAAAAAPATPEPGDGRQSQGLPALPSGPVGPCPPAAPEPMLRGVEPRRRPGRRARLRRRPGSMRFGHRQPKE
jgi:EmrB/QacA subfamily drug resistance transporter